MVLYPWRLNPSVITLLTNSMLINYVILLHVYCNNDLLKSSLKCIHSHVVGTYCIFWRYLFFSRREGLMLPLLLVLLFRMSFHLFCKITSTSLRILSHLTPFNTTHLTNMYHTTENKHQELIRDRKHCNRL